MLRLATSPSSDAYAYGTPETSRLYTDFYLISHMTQVKGPADSLYGLIFRAANARHYFFGIDNNGRFVIRRRGDTAWAETLLERTYENIRAGDDELIVIGQTGTFTLCVNGENVAVIENSSLPRGRYGVGVLPGTGDGETIVEYDDFVLYVPQF